MLFSYLLAFPAAAVAATIKVDVGKDGLTFTPDSVTAAKGDVLEFHYVGGVHDVVQGDFDKPCQLASNGFASKTETGSADNKDIFKVTVNSTDPIYYYCSVGAHCANGMVAAINPASDKTVEAFRTAAKGKTAERPKDVPIGGQMSTAD